MNELVVTRATLRIEYSDGQVRELDVPNPRDVRLEVTPPDMPPLEPIDPAYLICMPLPATFWRVEMAMNATPSKEDPDRRLITTSGKPYLLDPGLAKYLDWPLYFPDDSVHCDKFPACQNRDCRDPESGQVYIASARRMTVREFLADVKAHAEDASGTT